MGQVMPREKEAMDHDLLHLKRISSIHASLVNYAKYHRPYAVGMPQFINGSLFLIPAGYATSRPQFMEMSGRILLRVASRLDPSLNQLAIRGDSKPIAINANAVVFAVTRRFRSCIMICRVSRLRSYAKGKAERSDERTRCARWRATGEAPLKVIATLASAKAPASAAL